MKKLLVLAALLSARMLEAQVVVATPRGIVVADAERVTLHDETLRKIWSARGPANPSLGVTGERSVAILDAWTNEVRTYELSSGKTETMATRETPIAAAWIGDDLYVVSRDTRTLQRMRDGALVLLATDPAFLRVADGKLYVYSRLGGVLQEIDPASMRITRRAPAGPFASDFEVNASTAYFAFPRDAKIRTVALKTFQAGPVLDAGAVPTDLAIVGGASALSATRIAVADPSAKRIWTIEGTQSTASAFSRGFVRGLLGLGLYRPQSREFPTGVDRVLTPSVAYDSSSRTLFTPKPLSGIGPMAFALVGQRVAVVRDGVLTWVDHGTPVAKTGSR